MRKPIDNRSMSGRVAAVGCVLVLLLAAIGCSTSDQPAEQSARADTAEYEDFEEFSFPAPEGQDYQCDGDCGPRTMTMCELTKYGEVLAFVRVVNVTEHRADCDNRPYRHDYRDVEIDVLDIAAGAPEFANATVYRDFLPSGAVEVGKPYIMKFKLLDEVWWNAGLLELVPGAGSTEVSPREPTSEHQGGTIYDLPTSRADFVAEAERVWSNYEEECDPDGRPERDFAHDRAHIYGTSGACERGSDTTVDSEVNNIDGPIPGDDTYDAGG